MPKKGDDVHADTLKQVEDEVNATKNVMINNIDKAMNRGEKLTELEHSSERLQSQAITFRKKATDVKTAYCWQNWKLGIIIGIICAIILGLIIWLIASN